MHLNFRIVFDMTGKIQALLSAHNSFTDTLCIPSLL